MESAVCFSVADPTPSKTLFESTMATSDRHTALIHYLTDNNPQLVETKFMEYMARDFLNPNNLGRLENHSRTEYTTLFLFTEAPQRVLDEERAKSFVNKGLVEELATTLSRIASKSAPRSTIMVCHLQKW